MKRLLLLTMLLFAAGTPPAQAKLEPSFSEWNRGSRAVSLFQRRFTLMPHRPVTLRLGEVPATATVEVAIRIDGRIVEQSPVGSLGGVAATREVVVMALTTPVRGPLLVRAVSFEGAHRVQVTLTWARDS